MGFEWGKNDGPGDFESFVHRRVAAQLSVPLTVAGLLEVTRGQNDPEIPDSESIVRAALDVLVSAGHVKNIGRHADAAKVVKALKADDDVISLHPEKAKSYQGVVANPRKPAFTTDTDDLYVLTGKGLEALQA